MVHEISFPGLGIGPFTIDSVAFTLFGREIQWYGILICIGMILAYLYASTRAKFEGIKTDELLDLGFFVILFGIIGARLLGECLGYHCQRSVHMGRRACNFRWDPCRLPYGIGCSADQKNPFSRSFGYSRALCDDWPDHRPLGKFHERGSLWQRNRAPLAYGNSGCICKRFLRAFRCGTSDISLRVFVEFDRISPYCNIL